MIGVSESQNLSSAESQSSRISEKGKTAFISRFSELNVYRKSFDVSLRVHTITLTFPKIEQYGGLADQMRRASKSICSNIAEGYAKQQGSKAEFKRYLLIAIGSAHEMQVWIEYCSHLCYIDKETAGVLFENYDEIVRMLQSLYSKV